MSQKKVDRHKADKKKRKNKQKKKGMIQMVWIVAGCLVFGGGLGFLLGKYVLYPTYQEKKGDAVNQQSGTGFDDEFLQEINRQIQESDQQQE